MERDVLITGWCWGIGCHVVRLFENQYPVFQIVNLDKLIYAGNLANENIDFIHVLIKK